MYSAPHGLHKVHNLTFTIQEQGILNLPIFWGSLPDFNSGSGIIVDKMPCSSSKGDETKEVGILTQ
jgi:hypothetical protein